MATVSNKNNPTDHPVVILVPFSFLFFIIFISRRFEGKRPSRIQRHECRLFLPIELEL